MADRHLDNIDLSIFYYVQVCIITVSCIDIEVDIVNEMANTILNVSYFVLIMYNFTAFSREWGCCKFVFLEMVNTYDANIGAFSICGFSLGSHLIVYMNCLPPRCDVEKQYYESMF